MIIPLPYMLGKLSESFQFVKNVGLLLSDSWSNVIVEPIAYEPRYESVILLVFEFSVLISSFKL